MQNKRTKIMILGILVFSMLSTVEAKTLQSMSPVFRVSEYTETLYMLSREEVISYKSEPQTIYMADSMWVNIDLFVNSKGLYILGSSRRMNKLRVTKVDSLGKKSIIKELNFPLDSIELLYLRPDNKIWYENSTGIVLYDLEKNEIELSYEISNQYRRIQKTRIICDAKRSLLIVFIGNKKIEITVNGLTETPSDSFVIQNRLHFPGVNIDLSSDGTTLYVHHTLYERQLTKSLEVPTVTSFDLHTLKQQEQKTIEGEYYLYGSFYKSLLFGAPFDGNSFPYIIMNLQNE